MRTLAEPASVEVEIRRSRFIAHASRVDDLAATLAFYESVADPAATHNCWAWRLDHRYRFNDDGEPSSSAGRPILAAIEGKELENAMVVVTRYFGGVKLGIGGLIRAYGGTAAKCLDQAGILEIAPHVECLIRADFAWTGQVYAALEACAAEKLSEDYRDDGIEIRIRIEKGKRQALKRLLTDATRGEARLTTAD